MTKKLLSLLLLSCTVILFFLSYGKYLDGKLEIPKKQRFRKDLDLKHNRPDGFFKYMANIHRSYDENDREWASKQLVKEFEERVKPFLSKSGKGNLESDLSWKNQGPDNISGRTRALIVDKNDATKNTWFAGAVGGGIWKTTNRGKFWYNITDKQIPNLGITALVQSNTNPSIMYAGTGEGFNYDIRFLEGGGIFKSVDSGDTWAILESTTSGDYAKDFLYINRLLVDPKNENILLVASNTGIFRSTDGGKSWTAKFRSYGVKRIQHLIANPKNFNVQFASVQRYGILKSTDAGVTWTQKMRRLHGGRMELAISSKDTARLYASADSRFSESAELYISVDSGESWHITKTNGYPSNWLGSQGWFANAICVDPDDPNTVFLGGVDLYKTTIDIESRITSIAREAYTTTDDWMIFDHGGGWGSQLGGGLFLNDEWIGLGNIDQRHLELYFGPGRSQKAYRFYAENERFVPKDFIYKDYVSVPFEVWDKENNKQLMVSFRDKNKNGIWDLDARLGAKSKELIFIHDVPYKVVPNTNIARDVKGSELAIGYAYKLFYILWPAGKTGITHYSAANKNIPDSKIVIGKLTKHSVFKREKDTRISHEENKRGMPKYVHEDIHSIQAIDVGEGENYMVFSTDGGIYYSENKGETFSDRNKGYVTTQFYDVARHPLKDQYIGGMQDNGTWRTALNKNWTEILGGDGFDVVWHSKNPKKIIASIYSTWIHVSYDAGKNWHTSYQAERGSAPFFTSIASSKEKPELLFSTLNKGILRSEDFGLSWTVIDYPELAVPYFSKTAIVRVSLANPNIVWAVSGMVEKKDIAPLVSTDTGKTFKRTNISKFGLNYLLSGFATHPYKDSVAYLLFSSLKDKPQIVQTANLGKTWKDISGKAQGRLPLVDMFTILVIPDTTKDIYPLWLGTEIGLFISDDNGKSWHYSNNGLPPVSIWKLKLVGNQVLVATYGRGIWTVDLKNIRNSEKKSMKLNFDFLQNPSYPKNAWFTVNSNLSLASVTGTYSQGTATTKLKMKAFSSNTKSYFYDTDFRIFGNEDIKISMTIKSAEGGYNKVDNYIVKTMMIKSKEPKRAIIYYGKSSILIPKNAFSDDIRLYVTDRYLSITTTYDQVKTKHVLSIFPHEKSLNNELTINFEVPKRILRRSRIYFLDTGKNWKALKTVVNGNRVQAKYDHLGVFRVFLDSEVRLEKGKDYTYRLGSNYPNPFNPTTVIPYELKESGPVKISIYNSLGQLVKTLLDRNLEGGRKKIIWNGKNNMGNKVSSGVYYYQMIAGSQVFSKKMILLK